MNDATRPRLLIATANADKLAEFRRLLPADLALIGLRDVGAVLPPEDGTTYAENAGVKAMAAARQSGLLALGDDSGLEVDALEGRPGIYSARFAGSQRDDEANRARLLAEMNDVPDGGRGAQFVCALALASPAGVVARAEETCEGTIGWKASGTNGFGYDPLFTLPSGQTLAELSSEEKDRVSHRGRAVRALLPLLRRELGRFNR
ncbi:MAG TPA: RdgB/HAM1 family non-canonical purine NTP pyrophosphatase [Thermomicrobiales bacterium]|nr:RdgB/HAM1 family non-canonical purine NTP pyrophosphatase [Thermomicrobiales bacterium]